MWSNFSVRFVVWEVSSIVYISCCPTSLVATYPGSSPLAVRGVYASVFLFGSSIAIGADLFLEGVTSGLSTCVPVEKNKVSEILSICTNPPSSKSQQFVSGVGVHKR
jgi:hypothetical protein